MFERNHQLVFFDMERDGIMPGEGARHSSCYHSYCTLLSSHCVYLTACSSPPSSGMNLCNNAITSQRARMCERLCVLCVTYTGSWHSLILRENTDAAFCFCPCFTSRVVFISTMVIGFPAFYGPCIALWIEESSKGIHWSKDPVPLSPFLPCQSFMNASGEKVAVRELQRTKRLQTKRWKTAEP